MRPFRPLRLFRLEHGGKPSAHLPLHSWVRLLLLQAKRSPPGVDLAEEKDEEGLKEWQIKLTMQVSLP